MGGIRRQLPDLVVCHRPAGDCLVVGATGSGGARLRTGARRSPPYGVDEQLNPILSARTRTSGTCERSAHVYPLTGRQASGGSVAMHLENTVVHVIWKLAGCDRSHHGSRRDGG